MSPVASLQHYATDDRRRDSYVALREWQRRTGQTPEWEQVLFPDEILAWASQQPDVATMLRHTY
jgi:hypothetical protein